jgi:predicted 2-oxoglutarate/Fe(II)-dependent dioxygenase YbiX
MVLIPLTTLLAQQTFISGGYVGNRKTVLFNASPDLVPDDRPHLSFIDSVFQENVKSHEEVVRESEEMFYGFYGPDGFDKFEEERAPSEWICYSGAVVSSTNIDFTNTPFHESMIPQSRYIWESVMELEKRIIPLPFTEDELARVSKTPILSAQECQEIIDECESHYWGWGSTGSRYGTPAERIGNILKLEDLSRTYSLVSFELLPRLFPAIANAFPTLNTSPENLRLAGSRIVRYNASEGRVELGLHKDGKLVTANIALNDHIEYEGGGTYVEGLPMFMDNPIKLEKGHVLLHPGDVSHGGAPITKGQRYVLVCFIIDKKLILHEKYCLDRMYRDIEALRAIQDDDNEARIQEREALWTSATKHCADASRFSNTF